MEFHLAWAKRNSQRIREVNERNHSQKMYNLANGTAKKETGSDRFKKIPLK